MATGESSRRALMEHHHRDRYFAWGAIWNFFLLISIASTNLLALYSLSATRTLELNLAAKIQKQQYTSVVQQVNSIRDEIRAAMKQQDSSTPACPSELDKFRSLSTSVELLEYTQERQLPLGKNPSQGIDTMVSSIGHACLQHLDLLHKYMNYTVGGLCPDDWDLAQALMVRGCEPLPRRRCFARTARSSAPNPLPNCRWSTPLDDDVIRWTHYACKSFVCLAGRARNRSAGFVDCADCFDLSGVERQRWMLARGSSDLITIPELVAATGGGLRVGLDIGGGTGSFAARMAEYNITILTSTLNLGGPFNEFVAARGLVPLFLTVGQRLPFFDGTLDIVHSMHVLSNWIPVPSLEFLLFDIDRVLRPGGILWLDRFFCTKPQLDETFGPMVQSLGYRKMKWSIAPKLDRNGVKNHEVYLSALLEKPVRQDEP